MSSEQYSLFKTSLSVCLSEGREVILVVVQYPFRGSTQLFVLDKCLSTYSGLGFAFAFAFASRNLPAD